MNWLSRLLGKSKSETKTEAKSAAGSAPLDAPAPEREAPPPPPAQPTAEPPPAEPAPAPASEPVPEPLHTPQTEPEGLELEDDEAEDPEDEDDADPTIGRYEPLDDTALDGADLLAKRGDAERLALSTSHKVGPADSAGPGSLLEALMRLEAEGRVASRVCDDAESGFYILYEPTPNPA